MADKNCCSYRNALSTDAPQKDCLRVACLYRVSTTKQVDHDDENRVDIPVQRIACHNFCDRMGWAIVIEEIEDGVSGFKVSANDRDKIQLLKQYAEQDKFDVLLIASQQCIDMPEEYIRQVIEWLYENNVEVWSVCEGKLS